ncbi:MAG: ParA family protein [Gammaproteobacteria bacterium]|nr:ParA family protein [Gammaproteobacteria bacterium]MBU2677068.1 ParA family protein [Gammaproteobacteria bacterium]NNC57064.1 ParA family protein [Woeseiaceae bacterium]NNL50799.1 ParA family protein [Woeseiaceae bacterium]
MKIAPYRDDSNKIVILNPKGGCGKTTLATNLASFFALRGPAPTLIDTDPMGYTSRWLERRPKTSCMINGITIDELAMPGKHSWSLRKPKEAGAVIIDTPAALGRREIAELTDDADCVLVPVLPSAFDTHATANFIAELLLQTEFDRPVAVVANRTRQNTKSLSALLKILNNFETPTIAILRDSQNYVHAANLGLGIYELPQHRVKQDLEQMGRIIDWLDQLLLREMEPGLMTRFNPLPRLFASPTSSLAHQE